MRNKLKVVIEKLLMHVCIEIWQASEYSEVQVIRVKVEGIEYFDSPQAICIGIVRVSFKSFIF